MVLVIDNYDSFVFNLARYIMQLGYKTQVVRNDKITLSEISHLNPSHIVLSPGPKAPDQAGITLAVIQHFYQTVPMLGVCLGHQALGQAFGGVVSKAKKPLHGKASVIKHTQRGIFKDIKKEIKVGRYHSLIVSQENFPGVLEITAYSEEGEVMALQHRDYPVFGVQFHPESVLTESGYDLLTNFLSVRHDPL